MATVSELISVGRKSFFEGSVDEYKKTVESLSRLIAFFASDGKIDAAFALEGAWYQSLVKLSESEENYFRAFQWQSRAMWDAGRKFVSDLQPRNESKVCFVVPAGALLGHTEVMLQLFRAWRRNAIPVDPVVVSLSGFDGKLDAALRDLGISFFAPSPGISGVVALAHWARDSIAREGCHTAVWVSVPVMVSFLFGFGLAPRQVLWSLKFHPVHLGETVTHIGMTPPGDGEALFNGHPWKRFSPPLSLPERSVSLSEVAALRRKFGGSFLFGSLARTEKFNSTEFADAIVQIVGRCSGSLFVYTGREDSPVIKEAFAKAGLSHLARFVGWVDTNLYARVIDTFLETFPFGCGVTGAQAVNAGTRTVSLWRSETLPWYYFPTLEAAQAVCAHWSIEAEISGFRSSAEAFFAEGRRESVVGKTGVLSAMDDQKAARFHELLRAT